MERINKIFKHELFVENLSKIKKYEKDRIFCRHGIEHLLDVARIGCIYLAEYKLQKGHVLSDIIDEYIYAAALLHDLGRAEQYEKGIPHEQTGAVLARTILLDCDFDEKEADIISRAILQHSHGQSDIARKGGCLADILYKADKASRCCFSCDAYAICKWSEEEKNKEIII